MPECRNPFTQGCRSSQAPSHFVLRRERQQESVLRGGGPRRRERLQPTSRFLGHPSVGGRLSAGAARQKEQGGSRPSSKAPKRKGAQAIPVSHALACKLDVLCLRSSSLAGSRSTEQTRTMKTVPSFQAEKSLQGLLSAHVVTFVKGTAQASNPSIERTCQRPLRALWPAAHVER